MSEATHCYVGYAPCGCLVAAVVDMPNMPESTAEDVAEFIRDGYRVERIELAGLHDGTVKLGHKCGISKPAETSQRELFA